MQTRILKPCPDCGAKLTYEKGFAGTYWEPLEEARLYCEECDWVCEDWDSYIDDRGNEE